MGECDANPGYMRQNCVKSCDEYDAEVSRNDQDIAGIESFYDLEADDIDGNPIKFDAFRGKAVLITNVASYCGYTESHYKSLVALHGELKSTTDQVEILAFPCNQFGKQEPEECPVIKAFAAKKGVEFRMMYKLDVNGSGASPVYKWLKKAAGGPKMITWNFATYFLVSPDGTVKSFSGVEPLELKGDILDLLDREEL
eukprot:CAMPEP_0113565392 /NCGR_PEP_ID=MMETSP0015_2-20120614/22152_1 /TAXON_ID=2838 /ORGANISM="Odontella" /LENGTH=197 /DNA_ID=CAMNT_0000467585 /DNA_START=1 /DNA_END=594 /DNA_ORIENTATION=+ /assembly_acc=CAM_ASM_000160